MNGNGWFSQFSLRFVWALVALVALNLAVMQGHGYYSRTAALEVSLARWPCCSRAGVGSMRRRFRRQAANRRAGRRREHVARWPCCR